MFYVITNSDQRMVKMGGSMKTLLLVMVSFLSITSFAKDYDCIIERKDEAQVKLGDSTGLSNLGSEYYSFPKEHLKESYIGSLTARLKKKFDRVDFGVKVKAVAAGTGHFGGDQEGAWQIDLHKNGEVIASTKKYRDWKPYRAMSEMEKILSEHGCH